MCDFPYEDQARSGLPVPDGLDLADTAVYMALRGLYAFYQLGMISKEAASAEKLKLRKLADDVRRRREYESNLADIRRYLIYQTEAARAEFRLYPSIERGFALCTAIDNAKISYYQRTRDQSQAALLPGEDGPNE